MDRLDLRLVEYFVAVAEELHFGRAADRLHIAQPSLSQQIRRLEAQLGTPLLRRTSRRVELTPAGEVLLREGRGTLASARRTLRAVRGAGGETLTVGFVGSAGRPLLADVLDAHRRDHPFVRVELREIGLDEVADIASGCVDVAFTRLLPDQTELAVEVILEEARVVALPAAHRLAGRSSLVYGDLRGETFITNPVARGDTPPARWRAEQRRHGLPGREALRARSIEEILTMVGAGRGVCLLAASVGRDYPRDRVRFVPVTDAEPAVVSLVWQPGQVSPAIADFVRTTRLCGRVRSSEGQRAA